MKFSKLFLVLSLIATMFISCKEDKKEETLPVEETTRASGIKKAPKKELSIDDKKIISSVLFKIMSDPQLKEFARLAIYVDLKDLLSLEEGPYTVFAPTNLAFEAIPEATMTPFLKPENKANFGRLIKSHIIDGRFSSEDLLQQIDKEGTVEFETLGGAKLKVAKEGEALVITDENGKKASLTTKDVYGANGVVHSLDAVLNIR